MEVVGPPEDIRQAFEYKDGNVGDMYLTCGNLAGTMVARSDLWMTKVR